MALSLVGTPSSTSEDTTDTSVDVTRTGVTAGNGILLYIKYEDVATDVISSVSDGTTTFTANKFFHGSIYGSLAVAWFYLPVSVASGTVTYTVNFSSSVSYKRLAVFEFSYSGTFSVVTPEWVDQGAEGGYVSPATISNTNANSVFLGSYGDYSGHTTSSELINTDAADGVVVSGFDSVWWKAYTSTAARTSDATIAGSSTSINSVIAVQEAATGYTITADAGSYALTGTAVTLPWTHNLTASAGSYALTGTNVTLTHTSVSTYSLACDGGSYSISGTDINALKGSLVTADSGVYVVLNDTQAVLTWEANTEPDLAGYRVYHGTSTGVYFESVDVGDVLTYTWTDLTNATHYFTVRAYDSSNNEGVPADEVSKVISQAVILTFNSTDPSIPPDSGVYSISGTTLNLLFNKYLAAAAGSYALTGDDATLTQTIGYILTADAGVYAISGDAVNLNFSGASNRRPFRIGGGRWYRSR